MEAFIELAKDVNIAQLVAMSAIFWVFYKHIDKRFDKIDQRFDRIEKRIDRLEERIDAIDKRLVEVDKRLTIVEFLIKMKECCVLKQQADNDKAL